MISCFFCTALAFQSSRYSDKDRIILPLEYFDFYFHGILKYVIYSEIQSATNVMTILKELIFFIVLFKLHGQLNQGEKACKEVLEDPEEIIAGFINIVENDNDLNCIINFINSTDRANKDTKEALDDEFIEEEF